MWILGLKGLSLSTKQRRNPCFWPSPAYQAVSMCHDWPVNKKAIVHLPLRMEGNSKCTSSSSVNLLGDQEQGTSQTLLTGVKLRLKRRLSKT